MKLTDMIWTFLGTFGIMFLIITLIVDYRIITQSFESMVAAVLVLIVAIMALYVGAEDAAN